MRTRPVVLRTYSSKGAVVRESVSVPDFIKRIVEINHPDTISELATQFVELLVSEKRKVSLRKIRRLKKVAKKLEVSSSEPESKE